MGQDAEDHADGEHHDEHSAPNEGVSREWLDERGPSRLVGVNSVLERLMPLWTNPSMPSPTPWQHSARSMPTPCWSMAPNWPSPAWSAGTGPTAGVRRPEHED